MLLLQQKKFMTCEIGAKLISNSLEAILRVKAQKEVKTLHSMAASPQRTKEKEQIKNEFK